MFKAIVSMAVRPTLRSTTAFILLLPLAAANEIIGFNCQRQREEDQKCSVTLKEPAEKETALLISLRGRRSLEVTVKAGQNAAAFRLPETDKIETISFKDNK